MVGLGGGIFIIPVLTLFLDVPIHDAVAASLIAVVATSTSGCVTYVRECLSNLRLAVTMETVLALGAMTGGLVGAMLDKEVLSAVFGAVMVGGLHLHGHARKGGPAGPSGWNRSGWSRHLLLRSGPGVRGGVSGPEVAPRTASRARGR